MKLRNPTRNVISDSNSLFKFDSNKRIIPPDSYAHSWTITNATVSVVSEKYVTPRHYSFKIQPLDDSSPIVFSLGSIKPTDNDINGSQAQFHCQVFPGTGATINCQITNVLSSISKSHTTNLSVSKWNAAYSPVVDVGIVNTEEDDIEFSVSLTLSNHGGTVTYLTLPMIVNELGFAQNQFVYNMRKYLPTFIWDLDKTAEFPNYRFTKLFHSLTQIASSSAVLYSRFYEHLNGEIDLINVDNEYRYSELINPEYVDEDYTDWLSQFNGAPLYRSVTTSANTEAIQDVGESITWQLKNAYFGRNAGTLEAIKECTKQVLSGEKIVLVFPGGQFFQINVYTLLSETPGVSQNGDTSPEVVAMIEKTKPMGFVLNHEAYDELPLILDDPTYGLLNTAPLA